MRTFSAVTLLAMLAVGCSPSKPPAPMVAEVTGPSDIETGRYLVAVGGCNDCHTPGFAQSGGKVPEAKRLQGNRVGYRGPWGVTYASNLRLTVANMDEDEWVTMLQTRSGSPPMSWPSVHAMSQANKRAVYRYVGSLGAAGEGAPGDVPPGVEPTTPYVDFRPVTPAKTPG